MSVAQLADDLPLLPAPALRRHGTGAAPIRAPSSQSSPQSSSRSSPQSCARADFAAQMVRLLPYLSRCARRLTGAKVEADDLVQETCRRALESFAQFSPGSNLQAWLACILRNFHRDRVRRAYHEVAVGTRAEDLPAREVEEQPQWAHISYEEVVLALGSLPPRYRETYALYAVDGLSYREIARRLGVPCSTVGTRLNRARPQLRKFLIGDAGAE
jgi:RNA polymerase sigma-70 factor (ECF subfamily)